MLIFANSHLLIWEVSAGHCTLFLTVIAAPRYLRLLRLNPQLKLQVIRKSLPGVCVTWEN